MLATFSDSSMILYYNVHPGRVYLLGHSNGGYMSYRLACDASDRITALASLAGATFKSPSKCNATEPVSVLQVHGTQDDLVPYEGYASSLGALEPLNYGVPQRVLRSGNTPRQPTSRTTSMGAETEVAILGRNARRIRP